MRKKNHDRNEQTTSPEYKAASGQGHKYLGELDTFVSAQPLP